MKKTALLFLVTLLSIFCNAQESTIKGKWKVNCALEKKAKGQLHVCDICPSTMLANNTAVIDEFVLEFTGSVIKLEHEEVPIEVAYTYFQETNSIKFKYLQKEYHFKIMIISDPFVQILVAESGEVLYLKKIL